MSSPTLTVAIACFDAASTVDLTVRSVLQANLDDVDVLVIDDASSDGSRAILDEWAKRDSRVRVIGMERNVGIGEVRNLALRELRGEYFAFVDGDDWVTRDYHAALVDACRRLDVDFVKSDHVRVTGTERTVVHAPAVRRGVAVPPLDDIGQLDRATMIDYAFVWPAVYRASFLREAAIDCGDGLRTAEDRVFTWKAHLRASRYACVSELGYMYRKEGSSSLTGIGDLRQLEFLRCIEQTFELLEAEGVDERLFVKAYRQALALVVFHFDRRERFLPEVWYAYRDRTREIIRAMDPVRLERVFEDFGERRVEIVQQLEAGTVPILDQRSGARR